MKRVPLKAIGVATAMALSAPLIATADHKPGHQSPPKGTGNLTITATPNPVLFGRSVTISGRLRGGDNSGKTIVLQHDPFPYGATYNPQQVAQTTTNAQGDYTFTVGPRVNTNYRTVAKIEPEARSDNRTVGVRMRITRRVSDRTPERGQLVTFRGTVKPNHNGRRVAIQRRRSTGTWRTVARPQLTGTVPYAIGGASVYRKALRINRDGVFRVKINSHGDHIGNKTRRIRLDVPPRS